MNVELYWSHGALKKYLLLHLMVIRILELFGSQVGTALPTTGSAQHGDFLTIQMAPSCFLWYPADKTSESTFQSEL